MRLWHQDLISKLPQKQLCGQHRECSALYGLGWLKPHSVINYIFDYPMEALFVYHKLVMDEMKRRGYKISPEWYNPNYRGKRCTEYIANTNLIKHYTNEKKVYFQHDDNYMEECLENLKSKGIILKGID